MPDPSTLDDSGEEDNLVTFSPSPWSLFADSPFKPLKVVQQKLENRQASPPVSQQQSINLFDDLAPIEPPRSTTAPPGNKNQSPKGVPGLPKPTKQGDSLLGLDFFGSSDPAPARPASVNSNPVSNTTSSRPDLNRSILSLYASKPQPRPHPQNPSFSGGVSQSSNQQKPSSSLGGLNDVFGGLSFVSQNNAPSISTMPSSQPAVPKPSPFANLTAGMMKSSAGSQLSPTSTGGFFGPSTNTPKQLSYSKSNNSAMDDLFDFSSTPGPTPTQPAMPAMSAFNLGTAPPKQQTTPQFSFDTNAWATPAPTISTAANNESAWGTTVGNASLTSNAWGSPMAANMSKSAPSAGIVALTSATSAKGNDDDEWGAFSAGGTTSGAPVQTAGFGQDDLFGNVWK